MLPDLGHDARFVADVLRFIEQAKGTVVVLFSSGASIPHGRDGLDRVLRCEASGFLLQLLHAKRNRLMGYLAEIRDLDLREALFEIVTKCFVRQV